MKNNLKFSSIRKLASIFSRRRCHPSQCRTFFNKVHFVVYPLSGLKSFVQFIFPCGCTSETFSRFKYENFLKMSTVSGNHHPETGKTKFHTDIIYLHVHVRVAMNILVLGTCYFGTACERNGLTEKLCGQGSGGILICSTLYQIASLTANDVHIYSRPDHDTAPFATNCNFHHHPRLART